VGSEKALAPVKAASVARRGRAQKVTKPAPPEPKAVDTYHHGSLREALIACGLHQLTAGSAQQLSLRGVARMAGVSPGAPLHHFSDKQELLAAIAAHGFRNLTAMRLSRLAELEDLEARVHSVFSAYVEFALERPALFHLMFGPEIADKRLYPELLEESERSYRLLTTSLEKFVEDRIKRTIPGELAAFSLWTSAHGLATLLADKQRAPRFVAQRNVGELCRDQCSTVLKGILAQHDGESGQPDDQIAKHHGHSHGAKSNR
jgi:AcrR family transcriptional regulator